MGWNIDLINCFGAPEFLICKVCNYKFKSYLHDRDIEDQQLPIIKLECQCPKCDSNITFNFKIEMKEIN